MTQLGAQSLPPTPLHQGEPSEVAEASVSDATWNWTCGLNMSHEEEASGKAGQAGGTTSLTYSGKVLGSCQVSWKR